MDDTIKHDKQLNLADVDGKKKKKRKHRDHDSKNSVQAASDIATDKDTKIDDAAQSKDIKTVESKEDLPEKKKKKPKRKHDESTTQASLSQDNNPPPTSLQAQSVPQGASCPDLKPKNTSSSPSKTDPATVDQKKSENQSNPPDLNEEVKTKKQRKKDKKSKNVTESSQTPSSTVAQVTSPDPTSTSVTPGEIEQFISSNKLTYEPPETSSNFPPVLKFEDVKVHGSLRKAFTSFRKPSPIQSAVWPVLMAGRDVVGIAETGSGKTLAFGVPALQHILNTSADKKTKATSAINVLVVAPTRELAMQTETTLCDLGKLTSPPIKSLCVYGGVDKSTQRKALANSNVRVVVGTPGRLLDLANEGNLKLDQVSWLVLDEADRMLDKGFENDIRAIINLCLPSGSGDSKARLTTMFSATWPTNVRRLAADFMHNPVRILVGADELTASCSVEQTVEVLEETRGKEWKLLSTLQALSKSSNNASQKDKIIVFALYKKEAQRLYEFLIRKNFQACCIEGNMSQDKRSKALDDFMTGKATILVATDVAARGLDIPKVEFVINVTFPLTIEDYIHRIGRTGRAGRKGKSITFFTDEDKSHAGELMRVLKDAGQVVPEALKQWGGQIKKKTHAAYGDHWKDVDFTVKAKKITFD